MVARPDISTEIAPMLLVYLVITALVTIPLWLILPRAGLPGWAALAAVFPFGAIILLWILALKRWPDDAP